MGRKIEENYDAELLHLWLNNIQGISVTDIINLKNKIGNVWKIYEADRRVLLNILSESKTNSVLSSKDMIKIRILYERLLDRGVMLLYPEHSKYPEKLKNIFCPPQLLYIRGKISCLSKLNQKTLGIVGSRNPSVYGREICGYFSTELAKRDINIVSGLARGIDSIAHRSTLRVNGTTIAVLGCGINVTYPAENIDLYEEIAEKGIIMSEYGLDVNASKWTFPIRNRIISGLADGVLVVEARAKSGSLITADHSLEQGRQVYAIPGRLMDKCCEGTNNLIRQGAICVNSPRDILEDLYGLEFCDMQDKELIDNSDENDDLSYNEEKIIECLGLEPVYIDDIIQKTCLGITKTISTLYLLEEKRRIKQLTRGYYILKI